MSKELKYYLTCSLDELITFEAQNDIINSQDRYMFTHFCQQSTKERIEALLNEAGIDMLINSENCRDKINGLLTSGKDFDILVNPKLCKTIVDNNYLDGVYSINSKQAISLMTYIRENCIQKTNVIYEKLSSDAQISILQETKFESGEIEKILLSSKKHSAEFLLQNRDIDLTKLTIMQIELLIDEQVKIPDKNFTKEFNDKLASISDINTYRFLIEAMKCDMDMEIVEEKRRAYYAKELKTLGEDGLLEKFRILQERIVTCESYEEIIDGLEGFENSKRMIYMLINSDNVYRDIKKCNDYYISNAVIDYLFQDVPTNVIKNLKSMLGYGEIGSVLSRNDVAMYSYISNIDSLSAEQKVRIYETLKDKNMVEKFYDDFSAARTDMVEQINQNIINKDNIENIRNSELSKQCGVPVYLLNGQKFYSIVRNVGAQRDGPLSKKYLDFIKDGSSFSLDSSNLLSTFGNIDEEYTLAYNGIPDKQLIHAFPVDSFSNYSRDNITDIPKDNGDATDRIIDLMTPEQITTLSRDYNEILASVPNVYRESNEFEDKLEKPEAIAIYCYDKITQQDIESAKQLGLGIILVNTKAYEIDMSKRLSMFDTTFGSGETKNVYMRKDGTDERMI